MCGAFFFFNTISSCCWPPFYVTSEGLCWFFECLSQQVSCVCIYSTYLLSSLCFTLFLFAHCLSSGRLLKKRCECILFLCASGAKRWFFLFPFEAHALDCASFYEVSERQNNSNSAHTLKEKKNKKQQNFFRHGVESNSKKKKNDQAYFELLITTETCFTLLVLSFLFCFVFRWFVISC